MNSDVLIIGAGVIGLCIARELHKKGFRRIEIVERGKAGQEASFAAAGMLAPNAETENLDDFYHFCSESLKLYPDFAAELFEETGVDIELDRSGTLFLAFSESDSAVLKKRFRLQREAGLNVKHLSAAEMLRLEPFISPVVRESLFFADNWQVENRKLLAALLKYTRLNGIEIQEHTEIQRICLEDGKITGAESASNKFLADLTILATGAWTSLIKLGEAAMPIIVKPIRGQMIGFHPHERLFQRVICSPRGYIVPRTDGRILAGATVEDAGFDKSVTEDGVGKLREAALEIAPCLGDFEISDRWTGLRPFAAEGLPILGEIPNAGNLFVATAHYRNGILLAPLTAKIIAARIAEGKVSEYLKIFHPQRFRGVEQLSQLL